MDNERNSRHFESVYSKKVRAGKRRTYFFDVRRTKGEDYYLTLTESSRRIDGGYERHKIFLYKEDLNRFVATLEETVNYIKTELMPQYDYDEFTRRQEEYEARMLEEKEQEAAEKPANKANKANKAVVREDVEEVEDVEDVEDTAADIEELQMPKVEFRPKPPPSKPPVELKNNVFLKDDDDDMAW